MAFTSTIFAWNAFQNDHWQLNYSSTATKSKIHSDDNNETQILITHVCDWTIHSKTPQQKKSTCQPWDLATTKINNKWAVHATHIIKFYIMSECFPNILGSLLYHTAGVCDKQHRISDWYCPFPVS